MRRNRKISAAVLLVFAMMFLQWTGMGFTSVAKADVGKLFPDWGRM